MKQKKLPVVVDSPMEGQESRDKGQEPEKDSLALDSRPSTLSPLRVHIRWMIRRDMPEVLGTEQESFEFSWTRRTSSGACGSGTASAWWPSTATASSAS